MITNTIRWSGFTDTATLVLFDPAQLADKISEECDWWTGDGDLEREEATGKLVFIDTGTDGVFALDIAVSLSASAERRIKEARLCVTSGVVLFGAAECLPGEGVAIIDCLGEIRVEPGNYDVLVQAGDQTADVNGHYMVYLNQNAG